MFSDRIEQLKRDYTDKYVKVDASRPELARFRDVVGQVKTVNMSGRALVEFLDYHLNIGWYDVDLSCVEIVDKPPPKSEKKHEAKPAAKPAAKAAPAGAKKLSPLEMARAQGAAGASKTPAKPAGGKPSTADILAAARGGKAASPAQATSASAERAPAEKPAAEAPAATPGKVDKSKMSVADMLAMARGGKAPAASNPTPAAARPAAPSKPKPEATQELAEEAPAKPAPGIVKVDRNSMSVDEKVAYCRKVDKH
jgi:hypothetical protein